MVVVIPKPHNVCLNPERPAIKHVRHLPRVLPRFLSRLVYVAPFKNETELKWGGGAVQCHLLPAFQDSAGGSPISLWWGEVASTSQGHIETQQPHAPADQSNFLKLPRPGIKRTIICLSQNLVWSFAAHCGQVSVSVPKFPPAGPRFLAADTNKDLLHAWMSHESRRQQQ